MKKIITTLVVMLAMAIPTAYTQVILAQWTFPTGNPSDSIADGGLTINSNKFIHTEGGTSTIDFSKNGASSKSAQATNWDNGTQLKCWVIEINTTGYHDLRLSSKMQSGGNNPGPRDYVVQYKTGTSGAWTDIPGADIVVANDWTTGVLDSVAIPAEAANKASVFIRWIMTSNTNSQGGTVTSAGINKIDDIYISGKQMPSGIKGGRQSIKMFITPNPSNGTFRVETTETISTVAVYTTSGKCSYSKDSVNDKSLRIELDSIASGTYIVNVRTKSGGEGSSRIIIID